MVEYERSNSNEQENKSSLYEKNANVSSKGTARIELERIGIKIDIIRKTFMTANMI